MKTYIISTNNKEISVDTEEVSQLDIAKHTATDYHVLYNNKKFSAKVLFINEADKKVRLEINGNLYNIDIADEYDQMVKKMGLLSVDTQKINDIYAPMPGLILDVLVTVGQEIKEGDQVLVLSAMKMENIITAPSDGVVKSIEVQKDAAVEKGQLLIEIE